MSFRFGWGGVAPPRRGRASPRAPLKPYARGRTQACLCSKCAYADTVLVPGAALGGATNERTHP